MSDSLVSSQDCAKLRDSESVDALLLLKKEECYRFGPEHGAFVGLQSDILPGDYWDTEVGEVESTMLVKVLNVTRATRIYLGGRDIIRLKMLERVLEDLLYPVEMIGVPTMRDDLSVAYDSRLHGLSEAEHQAAAVVYRALNVMVKDYLRDNFDASKLIALGRRTLETEDEAMIKLDFIRVAHPFGFQDIETIDPAIGAVAIIQVKVADKATLLDNVILAPRISSHDKRLWNLVKSAAPR